MPYSTIPTTTHHPIDPPWQGQRQRQPHTRTWPYPTQQYNTQPPTVPNVQPKRTLPYQSQDYIQPYISTRIAPCAPQPEATESQTVRQSAPPVFQPDAIPHYGEAPPDYEEVVRKQITATV